MPTSLPIDIDATYDDDPNRPGRKAHQQHHDIVHAFVNEHSALDHSGTVHPNLAAHDLLGLATQAELDAHAATAHGGTHPDLATHDALGLATQAELDAVAAAKASSTHAHTDLQARSEKGQPSGYADLDASGLLPTTRLPPLAISQPHVVASQTAMLALTAQRGDVAIRSDLNRTFILNADDPTVVGNWLELATPPDAVLSVNGQTGVVSLPSDGAAGTASLRTLGTGAQQAAPGNHGGHGFDATAHDAHDHTAAFGTAAIADLADVADTAPAEGNTLVRRGTLWTPEAPAAGGGGDQSTARFRRTGQWFTSSCNGTVTSSGRALTANTVYAQFLHLPHGPSITGLEMSVHTTVAGGSVRLMVFNDDGTVYPGTLALDVGVFATDTGGMKIVSIAAAALTAGLKWLAFMSDVAVTLHVVSSGITVDSSVMGIPDGQFNRQNWGWSAAQTYGAAPASFPAGGTLLNSVSPGNPWFLAAEMA